MNCVICKANMDKNGLTFACPKCKRYSVRYQHLPQNSACSDADLRDYPLSYKSFHFSPYTIFENHQSYKIFDYVIVTNIANFTISATEMGMKFNYKDPRPFLDKLDRLMVFA